MGQLIPHVIINVLLHSLRVLGCCYSRYPVNTSSSQQTFEPLAGKADHNINDALFHLSAPVSQATQQACTKPESGAGKPKWNAAVMV